MKKLILILVLTFGSLSINAQEVQVAKENKDATLLYNTIKLDAAKLIAGASLDVGYERYLSKYLSIGGNILIDLRKVDYSGDYNYKTNFAVAPYLRGYFSEAKEYGSKGFFAEGSLSLGSETIYSIDNSIQYSDPINTIKNKIQTTVGIGIGWKWANKSGFTFELNTGIGRRLIDNKPKHLYHDYYDSYDFYDLSPIFLRGGVFFGYSF